MINRIHDSIETMCRRYRRCNKININRSCYYDTEPFRKSIKFTKELEINKKISFSDVLLIRWFETTIYRKVPTMEFISTGICVHLKIVKRSALCSIITRAYKICTTKELSDEGLKRIEREIIEINRYPKWIVNQLKEEYKLVNEKYHRNIKTNINSNTVTTTTHILVLPYKGKKGEKLIK